MFIYIYIYIFMLCTYDWLHNLSFHGCFIYKAMDSFNLNMYRMLQYSLYFGSRVAAFRILKVAPQRNWNIFRIIDHRWIFEAFIVWYQAWYECIAPQSASTETYWTLLKCMDVIIPDIYKCFYKYFRNPNGKMIWACPCEERGYICGQ